MKPCIIDILQPRCPCKSPAMTLNKKQKKQLDLDVAMYIDDMTNPTLTAVNNRPNAAVLLDRGGKVLAFQNWFEPHAMRRALDELRG